MSPDEEFKLALAILQVLGSAFQTWTQAKSKAISPSEALDRISSLSSQLAGNNAAADRTVDERFPK